MIFDLWVREVLESQINEPKKKFQTNVANRE
jgi:hypothetical protein